MDSATKSPVLTACRLALRPLVRLLLKSGVTWREFEEVAKTAYVEVATDDFGVRGRPTNISRVAILTGINRRDVRKHRALAESDTPPAPQAMNAAQRVLSGWFQDAEFMAANGTPLDIAVEGPGASFVELWRRYGGDIPMRALLKELHAAESVQDAGDGKLKVLTRTYIPRQADPQKTLRAGSVMEDLGRTVVHDLLATPGTPLRFERRAENDAVDPRYLTEFRKYLDEQGMKLLENVDAWLTEHQVDPDKESSRTPIRLGVGVYHIQDDKERGNGP
jgi:Family of unknown function (DUF6502)